MKSVITVIVFLNVYIRTNPVSTHPSRLNRKGFDTLKLPVTGQYGYFQYLEVVHSEEGVQLPSYLSSLQYLVGVLYV